MAQRAQARQLVADLRGEKETRRLDEILRRLDHALAGDARPRHLRQRVEQQAAGAVGLPRGAVRERPGLVPVAQVGGDARPARRRHGLDAKLLEPVEQQTFDRLVRGLGTVQRVVGQDEPQREAVGGAAEGGAEIVVVAGMKVRREARQRARSAVEAMAAIGQLAIARERADRRRAERLDALAPAHARPRLVHGLVVSAGGAVAPPAHGWRRGGPGQGLIAPRARGRRRAGSTRRRFHARRRRAD